MHKISEEVVFLRAIQNWLERFCVKHPRIGIPRLMRYIIIGNIVVYLLDMFSISKTIPIATSLLSFSSSAILHGQVWRLITFVFVPSYGGNIFFFAVTMYFYYFIGTALEREWGSNKFTVFYFFGILLNILIGFFVGSATMYYVNMSMFFAFATLYPDLQFLLFFLIPVKAKWLAWFDAAYFGVCIIQYLVKGSFFFALIPVVAILNYLLFFAGDFMDHFHYMRSQAKHKSSHQAINFKAAQQHAREKKGYLHKCAVCGKTDATNPELEFRYCSKCNGYYCYCSDHINSHIHIL